MIEYRRDLNGKLAAFEQTERGRFSVTDPGFDWTSATNVFGWQETGYRLNELAGQLNSLMKGYAE